MRNSRRDVVRRDEREKFYFSIFEPLTMIFVVKFINLFFFELLITQIGTF